MKPTFFVKYLLIFLIAVSGYADPFEYTNTTLADFSGGDTILIDFLTPDPDGTDDGAIALSSDDTIRVLQVYPDGHCTNCIANAIETYMHDGNPSLNIKIEVIPISQFNSVSSPTDSGNVYDPTSGATVGTRCMLDYHIVMFGIANGFGGRGNDLTSNAQNAVIEYGHRGGGIMLTHDTIAKRRGWSLSEPWCLDTEFEHPYFNTLTPVTGLDAHWVPCAEPSNIYTSVTRDASADLTATILHYPFDLPDNFDVTQCHAFGEHEFAGQVWYRGPDGQIYMHSYHDTTYDSFSSYFSTGHQEEFDGDSFTPLEWETKGMINAMFYAFYGGRGNGIYTSAIIDAGCPVDLDSVAIGETLPGSSSVVIEIRVSDDSLTWSDWFEISADSPIPSEVPTAKYFQYRLSLSKGTPADSTPIVHWISFYGEQDIPHLELLSPMPNYATACSCGTVNFLIQSESDLSLDGCRIRYDGIDYSSENLSINGDTLIFTPPDCFSDCDTHTFSIERIENSIGCVNEPDSEYSFTVDLSPPIIIPIYPPPDTAIGFPFTIEAYLSDICTDVDDDSIFVIINGDTLDYGVIYSDDTLMVSSSALTGMELGGTTEVCIFAADTVSDMLCGPNDTLVCWNFYVDTTAPIIDCPDTIYTACDSLIYSAIIDDDVAVQLDSTEIVLDGISYDYPDFMHFAGDTLIFVPEMEITDGDTYSITVRSQDIFGNSSDGCTTTIIVDKSSPILISEPEFNDSVNTPQPTIILCISDIITGLDSTSVWLALGADTFTIGDGIFVDTCFIWSAESLGLSFLDGDTLNFSLGASDLVPDDFCGPNFLDTSWSIFINLPAPTASILTPSDGSCVSCSLTTIVANIWSSATLVMDSLLVIFDTETLGISDPRLQFENDSLIFTPDNPFANNDSVYFEVLQATDSFGSTSEHLASTSFIIDLSPPSIRADVSDGDTVDDPLQNIDFTITDSICGVFEFQLFYGGTSPIAEIGGESCLGDSLDFIFAPSDYGTYFPEDTISSISAVAIDCGSYCQPNVDSMTISFYVPDDDTFPPSMYSAEPTIWIADSVFKIVLAIIDSSGVYTPSDPMDSQDAYILWDSDGELVSDNIRAELYADSTNGDTIFLSSELILGQPAHTPFVWRAFFYDNDFDFERIADRMLGYTDVESVEIVPRPKFTLVSPAESIYTSCSDSRIKILIQSEDSIVLSSLVFVVDRETLDLSDSRCYMQSDTFIILPPYDGYSEGDVNIALVSGNTMLGYSIPPQSWVFTVDLTPPSIEFQTPQQWDMVTDPQFDVIVQLSDNLAGVDTSVISAYFIVHSDTFIASSMNTESFGTGYRVSIHTPPQISAGDTVQFVLECCDLAQICPANCRIDSLNFWVEPNFPCSLSTNPFTPNGDGFNDEVRFLYPKPFSHNVTLCIYDLGGKKLFCRKIPAGNLDAQLWDGTRNGKKVPAGTYIYTIDGDGISCRGTVTLAR